MNERIRELAEDAFFEPVTDVTSDLMYHFNEEKMQLFAELIVQECLYLCESTAAGVDAEAIQEAIKHHFGVEP